VLIGVGSRRRSARQPIVSLEIAGVPFSCRYTDRSEFLRKRGFSKTEAAKIIETVLAEDGRKPESVFDFVQGITAFARDRDRRPAANRGIGCDRRCGPECPTEMAALFLGGLGFGPGAK
jgi:hypothetical protein